MQAQTRSEGIPNLSSDPPFSGGHTLRSGEESMEHTFELMDFIPTTPHDSPLTGGYTPGSDEGRLRLEELMHMCTKLSKQGLDLEKEKDDQAVEILKLKKRVKKLEIKRKSSISHSRRRINKLVESSDDDLDKDDASKQGRNSDKTKPMFKDSDFDMLKDSITTARPSYVSTTDQVSTARPEVSVVSVPVSAATPSTPPTTTTIFEDKDLTIAQTLVKMRSEKAKEKGVVFRDEEFVLRDEEEPPRLNRSTTTLQTLLTIDLKDKGKGVLVEEEPDLSMKIKRSSNRKREQFTIKERAQFLVETIAAQRKFRAAQRAAEIRSKPPTKTQLRNMMITYLKHIGKFTHNQLKGKSYEELQRLYEREQKWINDFGPMDSKKEEKKSVEPESEGKKGKRIKRVADSALKQKSSKKQKNDEEAAADYDHKKEELRMWLTVVSDEEETVDPKILSTKYPIVDWESQNLGNVDMEDLYVYKIIRADGVGNYRFDETKEQKNETRRT
ncbi:hypothetical protein Tco_0431457 [Tanacetum coccineum]